MPKFKKEKLKIYQKLFQQFDRGERVINGNPQISLSLLVFFFFFFWGGGGGRGVVKIAITFIT